MYKRPHHRRIFSVLSQMDPDFLRAACGFGGGTCLALVLGEYRESVAIDFLCAATRALADDPAYLARCFAALSVSSEAKTMVRKRLR